MTDFQLRAAMTEIINTTNLSDPHLIATRIAEKVPAKLLRTVLIQALTEWVRVFLTQQRKNTEIVRPGSRPHNPSAKVAGVREAAPFWMRAIRDRCRGADRMKMICEFTIKDSIFAADERRKQARLNDAKAAQFDIITDVLKEYEAYCVGDLPEDVLASIFQEASE
jgi:hypothetical protein